MKTRFLPLAFVAALAFGAGKLASSQPGATLGLLEFRTALDQISEGQLENARVLLEGSRDGGEIAPENALILAYLQEKIGRNDSARNTVAAIQNPSPLTRAYASRLGVPTADAPTLGDDIFPAVNLKSDTPARQSTVSPKVNRLEKMMLSLVNADRTSRQCRALVWDDDLAAIARAHSAEMRDKKYFAHESPTPGLREPIDRYRDATGDSPRIIAENVYRAWGDGDFVTEKGVRDGHEALMKSPGHRENLLNKEVEKVGIGIATNAQGHIWLTQVFVKE